MVILYSPLCMSHVKYNDDIVFSYNLVLWHVESDMACYIPLGLYTRNHMIIFEWFLLCISYHFIRHKWNIYISQVKYNDDII